MGGVVFHLTGASRWMTALPIPNLFDLYSGRLDVVWYSLNSNSSLRRQIRMEYTEGMPTVVHPHITSDPNICGGSPCIEGTRITVRTIVIYTLHHGQTPEELLTHYPQLSLASIYDALSYYYDNRAVLDQDIVEHLSAPEIDSRL